MPIGPGVTLRIPSTGPAHDRDRSHLYVVLTEPCPAGKVLAVPICKIVGKFDPVCQLKLGDHDFVEVDSYIAYFHTTQYAADVLEKQVSQGVIHTDTPVSPELLARIRKGVLKSRQTAPVEKQYFQSRLGAEETTRQKSK